MNTCLDERLEKVVLKNLPPGRSPGTLNCIYQRIKVFKASPAAELDYLDLVFVHGNVLRLTLVRVAF